MAEQITVEEFHKRIHAQGASSCENVALKCVICGCVQSIASLRRADPALTNAAAEALVSFSCEGRLTGAGPWSTKATKAGAERRKVRGCDWTLGGLFTIHKLEVLMPGNDKPVPTFEIATAEEAAELERQLAEKVER